MKSSSRNTFLGGKELHHFLKELHHLLNFKIVVGIFWLPVEDVLKSMTF